MKSSIIRICQGQPELAVRLVQPGCEGGQLINHEDIRLVIRAPECNRRLKSEQVFTGCWPGYDTPWSDGIYPHEFASLVYPAFDTNENGDTVFRFDRNLWKLPPGRYWGFVEFNNGQLITKLDLDICNMPILLDAVTLTSEPCNTEVC